MAELEELVRRIARAESFFELATALRDFHDTPHSRAQSTEALSAARRTRRRLAVKNRAYYDIQCELLESLGQAGIEVSDREPGSRWSETEVQGMLRMRNVMFLTDQEIADACGCSRARVIQLLGTKVEARIGNKTSARAPEHR